MKTETDFAFFILAIFARIFFIIPFSVYGIPFSGYVNNFHIFCLCDCISVYVNNFLCYFNVTFQELFSTLSTASTSGSVRLRMENF